MTARCASVRARFRRWLRWGIGFVRAATTRRFHAGQAALAALGPVSTIGCPTWRRWGSTSPRGGDIVVPFHDAALAERFHAELQRMGPLGVDGPGEMLDGARSVAWCRP